LSRKFSYIGRGKNLIFSKFRVFNEMFFVVENTHKQADVELSQAQLKLEIGFTSTNN